MTQARRSIHRRRPIRTIAIVLALVLGCVCVLFALLLFLDFPLSEMLFADQSAQPPSGPQPGDLAPDFTLTTIDGGTLKLSDYHGSPVLLNFWATWCGPCREELPDIQAATEIYGPLGLVVLSVDQGESRRKVAPFVAEHGLTFPVALDTDGRVGDLYGVDSIPRTFFIKPGGKTEIFLLFLTGFMQRFERFHHFRITEYR